MMSEHFEVHIWVISSNITMTDSACMTRSDWNTRFIQHLRQQRALYYSGPGFQIIIESQLLSSSTWTWVLTCSRTKFGSVPQKWRYLRAGLNRDEPNNLGKILLPPPPWHHHRSSAIEQLSLVSWVWLLLVILSVYDTLRSIYGILKIPYF